MATFGEILAELRQDRNLTQKDLAKYLHVSPGTVSNYENNIHLPDLEKILILANYFGVILFSLKTIKKQEEKR